MSRKIYKNVQIKEVVCEIRLLSTDFDERKAVNFYKSIEKFYPHIFNVQNMNFEIGDKGAKSAAASFKKYVSEDRLNTIHAGPGLLSIISSDYKRWETYYSKIQFATSKYFKITGQNDAVRIGLRFINKFTFPSEKGNLEDFFNLSLGFPKVLNRIAAFSLSVVNSFEKSDTKLTIATAKEDSPDKRPAILLDSDCFTKGGAMVPFASIHKAINDLHRTTKSVFEQVITDRAREEMLGGVITQ